MDPCEDFYSYSCGGFFKSHQLLANQSMVNALTILNEDNMKVLRVALENVTNYTQVCTRLSWINMTHKEVN